MVRGGSLVSCQCLSQSDQSCHFTQQLEFMYKFLHSVSLCTLAKAFVKFMNLIISGLWNSRYCSITCHTMKICSTHECPCQTCLFLSIFESTVEGSLLRRTTPGTDRSVIPLQFPHSARFPFLGILMMMHFYYSSSTASICQHLFMLFVNSTTTVSPPHFSSSALIWSRLATLLVFRAFITSHISPLFSLFFLDLGCSFE